MKNIRCALTQGNERKETLDHMVKMMRGEEYMKDNFPMAYNALHGGNRQRMLMADNTAEYQGECRMEVMHVAYMKNDHGKLLVRIFFDPDSREGYDIQTLKVIDKETGEQIAENVNLNFTGDDNTLDVVCDIKERNYKDVVIKAELCKVADGGRIYPYSGELTLGDYEIDIQGDFKIDDPIEKKYIHSDKISITYYAENKKYYDYFFPDARKNGYLYIPFKGSLEIKNAAITDIEQSFLAVSYRKEAGPWKQYANNKVQNPVKLVNSRKIEWNFDPNWMLKYDDILKAITSEVNCTLHIDALTADGIKVTFLITNNATEILDMSERTCVLPVISIYKDCFVKGTQITLKDGEKTAVENLKKDDVVACGDGSFATVKETNGTPLKQTLGEIVLENGMTLKTTLGHLVMTAEGLKAFVMLDENDLVKTESGMSKIKSLKRLTEQECEIYVVAIENGRTVVANGIVTSDSMCQLTDEEKKVNERCRVENKYRRDYDSWMVMKENLK